MLRVRNTNSFAIHDRFDGVDYIFPPMENVEIEELAAAHIFGWGEPDKARALIRHGWWKNTAPVGTGSRKDAEEKLDRVIFTELKVKYEEASPVKERKAVAA